MSFPLDLSRRFKAAAAVGCLALPLAPLLVALMGVGPAVAKEPELKQSVDVCVYGATPGGITAAIAVQQRGLKVLIVEPSRWVGGMLGAGLKPLQDCPNYNATGGMTRPLIASLGSHGGSLRENDPRALNPTAIREDFLQLLTDHAIEVIYDHRVAHCIKEGLQITQVSFDHAPFDDTGCPVVTPLAKDHLKVSAKVFIDASYEGSFMPMAHVGYRVGRESRAEFDEEHAGVQPVMELAPIDPFIKAGDRSSGLLKWVEDDHGRGLNEADEYTQAYNFRYYTTTEPKHRLPIAAPESYRAEDFELVGRYVAHLTEKSTDRAVLKKRLVAIFPGWLNSGEWNYQRESLFSMSPVGISQQYADGDAATQSKVWKMHQDYLRGLAEFMRTDERIPQWYREEAQTIGLDRRAHPETQGWPHQLYVRVARRLKGGYTITAHDVYNKTSIDDPIGLAQYGIDTYPSRRIWLTQSGTTMVGLEGKMFIGGSRGPTNRPYPIPYRAITPISQECTNLLVPVCFSATHLGYASARMEPVFMICGESAGIAACQAIEERASVQSIDKTKYREALQAAGQKLEWDPSIDKVAESERERARAYSMEQLLNECDANEDGRVTRDEWEQSKKGWEWLFGAIDKNADGALQAEEYEAFQKYKQEYPDWQSRLKQ